MAAPRTIKAFPWLPVRLSLSLGASPQLGARRLSSLSTEASELGARGAGAGRGPGFTVTLPILLQHCTKP